MSNVTTGADIEAIAVDKNGLTVSIEGKIKGTKKKPRIVPGGNVQEDNVLPEWAIDVCKNKAEFVDRVTSVRIELDKILNKFGLETELKSVSFFNRSELNTPQAKEFACSPDFNCWTGQENKFVKPTGYYAAMRTAGGHTHFGFPEANNWSTAKRECAQWFDIFLGLQAHALGKGCDDRSRMYGQAGAFREKKYGIEYRVLNNWWATERGASWVYDQMMRAYEYFQMGTVEDIFGKEIKEDVQRAIKINIPGTARYIMESHGLEVQPL